MSPQERLQTLLVGNLPFPARNLAALWDMTEAGVRKWCREGTIPAQQINGEWWVSPERIREMFKNERSETNEGQRNGGEDTGQVLRPVASRRRERLRTG